MRLHKSGSKLAGGPPKDHGLCFCSHNFGPIWISGHVPEHNWPCEKSDTANSFMELINICIWLNCPSNSIAFHFSNHQFLSFQILSHYKNMDLECPYLHQDSLRHHQTLTLQEHGIFSNICQQEALFVTHLPKGLISTLPWILLWSIHFIWFWYYTMGIVSLHHIKQAHLAWSIDWLEDKIR